MGIPSERIDRLFALAREAVVDDEYDRAREYVALARRIAERNRCGVPPPSSHGRPVTTATSTSDRERRVASGSPGRVVVRCRECGATARYPFD